jgi:hypothetical protein
MFDGEYFDPKPDPSPHDGGLWNLTRNQALALGFVYLVAVTTLFGAVGYVFEKWAGPDTRPGPTAAQKADCYLRDIGPADCHGGDWDPNQRF